MNAKIFEFLNSLAGTSSFLDQVVIFFATYFGIALVLFAIFFLFFHKHKEWIDGEAREVFRKRLKEILIILLSSAAAWTVAYITKNILESPRPFLVLQDVHLLITHGGYDSLPSGHATFFAALAIALLPFHRRLGIFYFVSAGVIGLARIIAGIHFPLDILIGLILGFIIAKIVAKLSNS